MMNTYRARHVINLVLLAGLIGALGCASTRPPIPEMLKTETPTIGVVLRPTDPDLELQIPGKGRLSNTGRGALRASAIGGALGIYCHYGFILCVPAFATIGAIGGAIYGAGAAEPASDWEQAESVFKEVLSDLNIQQRVPDYFMELARSQTPYKVIRVEYEDLSSKEENVAYRAPAGKGIDAVLELTELAVRLRPNEIDVNPDRILMMDLRARLIRTSDGALLDERVITDGTVIGSEGCEPSALHRVLHHATTGGTLNGSECRKRSLAAWTAQNAQAFRDEITQAVQRLAQQIVKELFSDIHSSDDVQVPALEVVNR